MAVMGSFIYFAFDLVTNGIKIGMTRTSLRGRLSDDTGLELIGAIPIDDAEHDVGRLETAIHFSLQDHCIYGERFYADKAVVEFVSIALTRGVNVALAQFGDFAFESIGFRKSYRRKQKGDASFREGHLTRQYAERAWQRAQLTEGALPPGMKKIPFLRACPLHDWDIRPEAQIVRLRDTGGYAIAVRTRGDLEIVPIAIGAQ